MAGALIALCAPPRVCAPLSSYRFLVCKTRLSWSWCVCGRGASVLGARNVVLRSRHARCTVGKPREIMVGDGVISFTVVDIEPQIGCVVALYRCRCVPDAGLCWHAGIDTVGRAGLTQELVSRARSRGQKGCDCDQDCCMHASHNAGVCNITSVGYARAVALCAFFSCWWPQGPRV